MVGDWKEVGSERGREDRDTEMEERRNKRDTRGDINKKDDWSSWVFTTSRKFLVHGKKRGHGMVDTL